MDTLLKSDQLKKRPRRRPSRLLARLRGLDRSMSFAFRLGLTMSLLSLLCAGSLAFYVIQQYQHYADEQQQALSQTIVQQLASGMVDPVFTEDKLAMQLHLNRLVEDGTVVVASIVDEHGSAIASASRSARRQRQLQQWVAEHAISGLFRPPAQAAIVQAPFLYAPVALNDVTGAYALIVIGDSGAGFSLASASRQLALAVLAITLFALLAAFAISRLLARPVYRLLAISEAARSGRVDLIESLEQKSPLANEWGDILNIYTELGKEVKSNQAMESMLQRFVASDVADHLLSGNQRLMLEGSQVEATVLFVDIVDFTRTAESLAPEVVAALLNRYLEIFAACARLHRGTVDKFIGDAAMIVFGAPRSDQHHQANALACAHAIRETARQINRKREAAGLEPVNLRLGVNSGQMYAGILGSEHRMEFTVVGDAVNLASRLCNAAAPDEVLLSGNVCNTPLSDRIVLEARGQLMVKGKSEPVPIYRLVEARTEKLWVVRGLIDDLVALGDRDYA